MSGGVSERLEQQVRRVRPDAESLTRFAPFVEVDEPLFDALLEDYRLMKNTLERIAGNAHRVARYRVCADCEKLEPLP